MVHLISDFFEILFFHMAKHSWIPKQKEWHFYKFLKRQERLKNCIEHKIEEYKINDERQLLRFVLFHFWLYFLISHDWRIILPGTFCDSYLITFLIREDKKTRFSKWKLAKNRIFSWKQFLTLDTFPSFLSLWGKFRNMDLIVKSMSLIAQKQGQHERKRCLARC